VSGGISLWRISSDTPNYTADDRSGKGAEMTGGRWNRVGTPTIYASATRALACLETIVHLAGEDALPLNRYLVEITVPVKLWNQRATFAATDHVGWDALPAGRVSLDWGTAWLRGCTSLLAEVPSVIVPEEANIVINPWHAAIALLQFKKIRKWQYDQRLT
jgi:RES domain-containing protein